LRTRRTGARREGSRSGAALRLWSSGLVTLGIACFALACGSDDGELHAGRGVVRDLLVEDRQILIEHDDIPGLMPAMTMNFDVADPALLERLERGQVIDFALRKRGRSYVVIGVEVIEEAKPGGAGPSRALAASEDIAPAFALVDQDGERLTLADLHGRAVLLDFIFTHCPGPCPILTGIHVSLQKLLPEDLRARTHFVSISLDPERDTPEVLRAYALARGVDLAGWSFLTGSPAEIDPVLAAYGVGKSVVGGGGIEHTVATFLIDPSGRIAKRYLGTSHEPEAMLQDLRELL
jgi:protein SCO1/2